MRPSTPSSIRVNEADGVAFVFLREGFEATVDIADIPIVEGRSWRLLTTPTGHAYAYTRVPENSIVLMHRLLLGTPKGLQVDHVDGDGLNNRRVNIRNCTAAQNQANKAAERRSRIGIKGVSVKRRKYRAKISPGGKTIALGYFDTPEEAAAAYQGAARVLWGEFAYGATEK